MGFGSFFKKAKRTVKKIARGAKKGASLLTNVTDPAKVQGWFQNHVPIVGELIGEVAGKAVQGARAAAAVATGGASEKVLDAAEYVANNGFERALLSDTVKAYATKTLHDIPGASKATQLLQTDVGRGLANVIQATVTSTAAGDSLKSSFLAQLPEVRRLGLSVATANSDWIRNTLNSQLGDNHPFSKVSFEHIAQGNLNAISEAVTSGFRQSVMSSAGIDPKVKKLLDAASNSLPTIQAALSGDQAAIQQIQQQALVAAKQAVPKPLIEAVKGLTDENKDMLQRMGAALMEHTNQLDTSSILGNDSLSSLLDLQALFNDPAAAIARIGSDYANATIPDAAPREPDSVEVPAEPKPAKKKRARVRPTRTTHKTKKRKV